MSFVYNRYNIKKIIRIGNLHYSFEATRMGLVLNTVTGVIKIQKSSKGDGGEIVSFSMNESNTVSKGPSHRSNMLFSIQAKSFINKFKEIDFGCIYAALGVLK